ncbi:MAG: flippase [Ignavibacteriaceae bacterium]|nr:flippase [Ignavibacteriaceae bacterium]
MLEYVKAKLISYNALVKNFGSLSALQLANYIIPLITLPYLVRTLGPEKYGLVNFAIAFTSYFAVVTDYGFYLSATKDISIHRHEKEKISDIFAAVLLLKASFFILSAIIFLVLLFTVRKFYHDALLYSISFIGIIGSLLFPIWFFQGIERMKYILYINVSVRVVLTAVIFILITQPSDYITLAFLYSSAQVIIGIAGILVALSKFDVRLKFPSSITIKSQLKNGWNIFLSTLFISIYTVSNTFLLGLLTNNTIVGYFTAADKIRLAAQGILGPLSQSVYPFVTSLLEESSEKFRSFLKKIVRIAFIIGLITSVMLFVFSGVLVEIILGNGYTESEKVLRIICWLPLIIYLSNSFGIQAMLPLKFDRAFAIITFSAVLLNIVLALLLVPEFLARGTSISMLITEMFITASFFFYLRIKKINII